MPIKFFITTTFLSFLFFFGVNAQEENWEKFIATDEEKSGSAALYFILEVNDQSTFSTLDWDKFSIVRKISQGTFIVHNIDTLSLKDDSRYNIFHANNRWKLGGNLNKQANEYTLKITSEDAYHNISRLSNIKIVSRTGYAIFIRANYNDIINDILPLNGVIYIGQEQVKPYSEARVLDLNLNPNQINNIHHNFPALDGNGMVVSVKDNFYDVEDPDIKNRNLPSGLESSKINPHATEMATVIGGAGNTSIMGKGVAGAVSLSSTDFDPVAPDDSEYYVNYSIGVQNHSYGTSIENFYGVLAELFDKNSNDNPQLLHLFSSGNKGSETGAGEIYEGVTGYANLTGNFKMAKNNLVVGAVDTVGKEMIFSSKGPAYDGRIKPEVVAYSTAGTSNATSLISGASVLLQQAYKEQEGRLPASALLKALLINSAEDVGRPGPDFATGFGNVNAYQALEDLNNRNYYTSAVEHEEELMFSLSIPEHIDELKITLLWNDPAAKPNSNVALINDLDLSVSNRSDLWLPWILNPSPENITDPAVRGEDHLNNVEQVTISKPVAGEYTVKIKGYQIPEGPQQFYVAYNMQKGDQFQWFYPTGSDNMPYNGESGSYFRWESTFSEKLGKLEITTDEGENWFVINDNIDLSKGYLRWDAPEVFSKCIAKMVIANNEFLTDTFTISRPLSISVGFDCADSVMLKWNKLPDNVNYEVLRLGETKMEKFAVTMDTFHIYNKKEVSTSYVAVQPIFLDKKMIQPYLYNVDLQGIDCYIKSFLTEFVDDEGISLRLSLGTGYGVEKIIIERYNSKYFTQIGIIGDPGTENIFFDQQPNEGLNIYRAKLIFVNGKSVLTEEVSDIYLSKTPFIIYPNPVSGLDDLNILSRDYEDQDIYFTLFNQLGAKIKRKKLISSHDYLPLKGLPQGIYYYRIETADANISGKIVIY
ncbi:MAG: S8 family serine peptidase [Candidatus Cyclobacteriaceae bacterium M2_1C_046]